MKKYISLCLVALVVSGTAGIAKQMTLPEMTLEKREKGSQPIIRGMNRDYRPLSVSELSQASSLIVVARLQFDRSYLSVSQRDILTDFRIVLEQVIAGTVAGTTSPRPEQTGLTLGVYGGEMVINGIPVSCVDYNVNMPVSGRRYLLFLSALGDKPGHYHLPDAGIFELDGEQLKSLTKGQHADLFKNTTLEPLNKVIATAQATGVGR